MGTGERISLEQAYALHRALIKPLATEEVPLERAQGRTVCRDILASMDQPPFPRSPYDGYALIAADAGEAGRDCPADLLVVGKSRAGVPCRTPVGRGQAVRIMTGAVIPEGADCVVPQEKTDMGKDRVLVYTSLKPCDNYCFAGEDFKTGELLIPRDRKLGALSLSVAAQSGYAVLPVYPALRAAVLSTGDELAEAGGALSAGQIFDSNSVWLKGRLNELGVTLTGARKVRDEGREIAGNLAELLEEADLVVTTGGISVGEYDLLPQALGYLGAKILYHGVDIKPGMPAMTALCGGKPVVCLSGNPFAAIVDFELLVRHVLFNLSRDPAFLLRRETARAGNSFSKRSPVRRFLQGRASGGDIQILYQGNGLLRDLDGYQYLVEVPAGCPGVEAGAQVTVYRV